MFKRTLFVITMISYKIKTAEINNIDHLVNNVMFCLKTLHRDLDVDVNL